MAKIQTRKGTSKKAFSKAQRKAALSRILESIGISLENVEDILRNPHAAEELRFMLKHTNPAWAIDKVKFESVFHMVMIDQEFQKIPAFLKKPRS